MFYSIQDKLNRYRFSQACKEIINTPPVSATTAQPIAVLTQLQHKDVLMFLVAIKTFARQVPLAKIFIINDGSLNDEDLALLSKNLLIAEFYNAKQFRHSNCPTGGTWERLLAIASFINDHFIIQLDSDTLTLSPLHEVIDCIKANSGFVIGTWDNQKIESMSINSERVHKNVAPTQDAHVQMLAEASFSNLKDCKSLRYVRGCSGFTGFPKASFDKQFIIDFSLQVENEIGSKWHEWGSEQVMSNVVVANLKKSMVLPHPKYTDCNNMKIPGSSFVHFIGDCRFKNSSYADMAKNEIATFSTSD